VDFSGGWYMHEELDGCNETFERDYSIEIKQNGKSATLEVGNQNYIDCTVADGRLQCEGDLRLENGGYFDYSAYTLWYEGDDLEGDGRWTLYDTENNSCSGTSSFSAASEPTPGPSVIDFSGEWGIFEEHQGGYLAYRQFNYTINIDQTETRATLSRGNEHLSCNVVGEELVCEGTFTFQSGIEAGCVFDSYRLRYDGSDRLIGEASWSYSYQGNQYYGRSNLTTTRPEVGSVRISNSMDYTFPLVNFRACGSYDWGENLASSPIEPMTARIFSHIQPGCYDIRVCDDVDVVDGTRCFGGEDFTVIGGETLMLPVSPNSLRLN
jgi:hypothetical protein